MTGNDAPEGKAHHRSLKTKLVSWTPEACRAFDILKAEQGPRSGPRLAAEMLDLLLVKYGKAPLEKHAEQAERPADVRRRVPHRTAEP